MAALVAAIHNRDLDTLSRTGIMDGRDKPGHDDFFCSCQLDAFQLDLNERPHPPRNCRQRFVAFLL